MHQNRAHRLKCIQISPKAPFKAILTPSSLSLLAAWESAFPRHISILCKKVFNYASSHQIAFRTGVFVMSCKCCNQKWFRPPALPQNLTGTTWPCCLTWGGAKLGPTNWGLSPHIHRIIPGVSSAYFCGLSFFWEENCFYFFGRKIFPSRQTR